MTRNQIIAELFTSTDFNSCIKKMKPENLQDELKAEVGLILCEKPEGLIIELWELGKLRFYTVRIILNLIQSKSSPFYKKFRGLKTDFVEIDIYNYGGVFEDIEFDNSVAISRGRSIRDRVKLSITDESNDSYDDSKDRAMDEIENLYWYDKEILKLYGEHGTYRKVEEVTGIPFESIYKTVQKNCLHIRKKVA